MLFDQPVTRVPSLQFLLSKVHYYVVDFLRSLLAQLVSCSNDLHSVKKQATTCFVMFPRNASLAKNIPVNLLNNVYFKIFCG